MTSFWADCERKGKAGRFFRNFLSLPGRDYPLTLRDTGRRLQSPGAAKKEHATTLRYAGRCPREVTMASVPFAQLDGFIWMNGEFVPWGDAKIH
ncbi:hypothetical protein EN788_40875, partial [Mesorhizobium sp. M2D.F.Ca.ET.145.01.1.1]